MPSSHASRCTFRRAWARRETERNLRAEKDEAHNQRSRRRSSFSFLVLTMSLPQMETRGRDRPPSPPPDAKDVPSGFILKLFQMISEAEDELVKVCPPVRPLPSAQHCSFLVCNRRPWMDLCLVLSVHVYSHLSVWCWEYSCVILPSFLRCFRLFGTCSFVAGQLCTKRYEAF